MNRFIAFCFLLLMVSSCANRNLGRRVTLDPLVVSSTNRGLNVYRATAPLVWDITHTRVAISFNLDERTANGQTWIDLHPYMYPTDTLVLDAQSMDIHSVKLEGVNSKELAYDYKDNRLKIRFDKQYKTQDTIQISIKYKAMPYATAAGGSRAISQDRGLYFINTNNEVPNKPVQIWTQGETEATSHWMPTFDKPNERFTTQIEMTVPDSFKTLSNGYLLSQVRSGTGLRTDTWIMEKPIQPYVAMMAIGNYAIVEDEKWRSREVSYYVEPEYERYARLMFKNTPEMMEYFSKITGVPYPWNKYSQVVVRDYISGAMENTTATVFGEFMNQNAREIADKDHEDIVSHELFHQWFGDYVTAESWSHLTVNESFATYGEQLWRRYKYGDASADELAREDLNKYLSSARQSEPPLVRHRYSSQEEMFDLISYQKGGAILKYMHGLMGDSAFFKAMKIYLTQNALKPAEATHWRLAVEEATGQDWNWFFKQWYDKGGYPVLDIQYDYNDVEKQLEVTVQQKQDSSFMLPLKAEILYGNEKSVVNWDISGKRTVLTYPYKNGMRPVVIPDSRNWLVGRMSDNKQPEEFKAQFKYSKDNYLNHYRAVAAINKKLIDSNAQAVFSMALTDQEPGIRELALRYLSRQSDKNWQDKWRQDVAFMAVNDGTARVRAAAFDVLSAWKAEGSKADMLAALTDSSYNVAGAALNGLHKLNDDTAYALSRQVLQTDPKARLLFTALEIMGEKGGAADAELYTSRAPYLYGTNKIEFAHALATYIKNVRDIAAFEKTMPVYVQMVNSESIGSYRFAIGSFFFEAAGEYNERIRDARKNAEKDEARQKLDIMKKYAEQILTNEKEADYKRQYRDAMKIFD